MEKNSCETVVWTVQSRSVMDEIAHSRVSDLVI